MSWRAIVAAATVLGVAMVAAPAQETLDAVAMRDAAAADWRSHYGAVTSLRGVVQIRDRRTEVDGSYLRCELCVKRGDRWWLDFSHVGADGDWTADLRRHVTFVRGEEMTVDWPRQRLFEQVSIAPAVAPERFALLPLWRATGFWPNWASWSSPEMAGVKLDVLAALGDPRYEAAFDAESGRLVLERAGVDRIELEPSRGHALMARQIRDPSSGAVISSTEVLELEQVLDRLWLANRARVSVFAMAAGEESAPSMVNRMEVQAIGLQANVVGDQVFEYEPAPGTYFIDREGSGDGLVSAGGTEFLDEVIERVRSRAQRARRSNSALAIAAGSATAVVVLTICIALVARARRRRAMRPAVA